MATKEDNHVEEQTPISTAEIGERTKDYELLMPKQFGTKYKGLLFNSTAFIWNGNIYKIQYNHCSDPYCKWYGLPQEKFATKGATLDCHRQPYQFDVSHRKLSDCFKSILS
ncbi:hypothetical protein [Bacillus sp. 2205SS5-2]|uniref:hypothetical protein n=1 Tax=Bacillus sp. 2205SS5-2 TaxID=3109031 RepID=UPI003003B578